MNEEILKGDLEEIFDTARRDALEVMTNEDKAFLVSQREDKGTSSMAGVDLSTVRSNERRKKKDELVSRRKVRIEEEKGKLLSIVPSSSHLISLSSS